MDSALMEIGLLSLVITGMLVGLFGLLLVVFPGLTIIWLSILAYGLVTGFTWGRGAVFIIITALMLLGNVADNLLMGANARQAGTSWWALGLGLVAMLLGSLFLTPLGGLALAFIVVFIVEVIRVRNWRQALESTRGLLMGCGWAVAARFSIGLVMIGLWLIWYFLL